MNSFFFMQGLCYRVVRLEGVTINDVLKNSSYLLLLQFLENEITHGLSIVFPAQ